MSERKDADRFDCDLYRLINRAIERSGQQRTASEKAWAEVARELVGARIPLRMKLMHPDDVKATS